MYPAETAGRLGSAVVDGIADILHCVTDGFHGDAGFFSDHCLIFGLKSHAQSSTGDHPDSQDGEKIFCLHVIPLLSKILSPLF